MSATIEKQEQLVVQDNTDKTAYDLDLLKSAGFGDQSSYASGTFGARGVFTLNLAKLTATVGPWKSADDELERLSAVLGKADLAVRRNCLNHLGAPDRAGNTVAFAMWTNHLVATCEKAGLKGPQINKLRGKVREYRSAKQFTAADTLIDVTNADKKLAELPVKLPTGDTITGKQFAEKWIAGDKSVEGVDVPTPLRVAGQAQYNLQVSKKNNKVLDNFETFPAKAGKKERKPAKRTEKSDRLAIETAGSALARFAGLEVSIQLSHWATEAGDAILGPPSEMAMPDINQEDLDTLVENLNRTKDLIEGIVLIRTGDMPKSDPQYAALRNPRTATL